MPTLIEHPARPVLWSRPGTMNKKRTTLIIYPPGGYGRFVEWCLGYFSGAIPLDHLPFNANGNSHNNQAYNRILDWPGKTPTVFEYIDSQDDHEFAITHGLLVDQKHQPDYSVETHYVQQIRDCFSQIVLMNPGMDSWLLVLENSLTKMPETSYEKFYADVTEEFREQFGCVGAPEPWQLREMISYWFGRRYRYFNKIWAPIWDPAVINVSIHDLVHDFRRSLLRLFDRLGLVMRRMDHIQRIEDIWLPLQVFRDRDQLCQDIVNAVVRQQDLDWSTHRLNLCEEAFVCWQLRDLHKLDLLCYNLNVFPTNVQSLREKLINV